MELAEQGRLMTGLELPSPADPEYRQDPVTGRWVLISSERALRPLHAAGEPALTVPTAECPFCEGHEHWTPNETFALRSNGATNGPGWSVRVVANRYPAVRLDAPAIASSADSHRLEQTSAGVGHHEVVVETTDHFSSMGQLPQQQIELVLTAYQERLRSLRTDGRLHYALVFKNEGRGGGASQPHPHSQIVATNRVPALIADEVLGLHNYRQETGRCVFCDIVARELEARVRLVAQNDRYVAICPYASRFPGELWILPVRHQPRFENIPSDESSAFAEFFRSMVARAEMLTHPASYNFFLHTAPFLVVGDDFHWHFELTPRIVGLAGFELGGGMHINPIPPEFAATWWRRM